VALGPCPQQTRGEEGGGVWGRKGIGYAHAAAEASVGKRIVKENRRKERNTRTGWVRRVWPPSCAGDPKQNFPPAITGTAPRLATQKEARAHCSPRRRPTSRTGADCEPGPKKIKTCVRACKEIVSY
jgi:hypothetical protein